MGEHQVHRRMPLRRAHQCCQGEARYVPTCRNCFVRRAPLTATLSRRRMNWSVLPSPTDKYGSFGSDGGVRDLSNPEPSLKKRNYLLVHVKLPTPGKRFSLV